MTDTDSTTTSRQKTIYLAVLLFGGFTLLLIIYLIYKYFRMRGNDIRQQEMIERHNREQRKRIQDKQQKNIPEQILTDSIKNYSTEFNFNDKTMVECRNCSGPLNSFSTKDIEDQSESFMAYDLPNNQKLHTNFLCMDCQGDSLWNKTLDTSSKKKRKSKNKISINAKINFQNKNANKMKHKENNPYNNESLSLQISYQNFESDGTGNIMYHLIERS